MKHLTKMKSWIISLFAVIILCNNAVQVEAYTDMNGYPFVYDGMRFSVIYKTSSGQTTQSILTDTVLKEQNSYLSKVGSSFDNVNLIRFGYIDGNFVFPYEPDLYDYYVVGTYAFTVNNGNDFDFPVSTAICWTEGAQGTTSIFGEDFHAYSYNSYSSVGHSFSFKIELNDNTNFCSFDLTCENEYGGKIPQGEMWFCASIVPVAKSSEADQINQSILNELIKINQNLVTSNSLQQSTIDAINQHDAHEQSWFQQLIQSMGIGFTALYKQMTEEQDEQLTGFDTTTGDSNNQELSDNLDQVENVESALTTDAFDGMNNYTITNDIMGYDAQFATAFPIVASMIQSVFDSSGEFGIILSVTFTVIIASMLIGLYRYYKE